jgi:hypothetical protein
VTGTGQLVAPNQWFVGVMEGASPWQALFSRKLNSEENPIGKKKRNLKHYGQLSKSAETTDRTGLSSPLVGAMEGAVPWQAPGSRQFRR